MTEAFRYSFPVNSLRIILSFAYCVVVYDCLNWDTGKTIFFCCWTCCGKTDKDGIDMFKERMTVIGEKMYMAYVVEGARPRGWLKKTLQEVVESNFISLHLDKFVVMDCKKWINLKRQTDYRWWKWWQCAMCILIDLMPAYLGCLGTVKNGKW